MTASPPKVNGRTRPPTPPVLGDWQPIEATPSAETDTPTPQSETEPKVDNELIAQAKAEAIRAKAWAEAEEQRLRAEAEADAIRTKAEEEARRLRLANDRAERKAREDDAASAARIAESNRQRVAAERAQQQEAEDAERIQAEQTQQDENVAKADAKWRGWAIAFYALCVAVAMPVQISAFWNPHKPWMAGAPVLLEIAALVVAFGTAAAVANKRPFWHFRLITWVLAFIAAGVNFGHGIMQFDLATAIGTALASVFGPGVWDLHEHGRIRKRDGVPTRRERKAAEREAKAEVARKAAEEAQRAAEKEAAEKAAAEKLAALTELRKEHFAKVWEHAVKLAADLGEVDPNAVWERAKFDVDGAKPGESADVLRMRNAAATRVESARQNRPVNTVSKTMNAQRASQMPPSKKQRIYNPPARSGRRTKGDTAPYVAAARKQAAITAKNSSEKKG
ncbi:hypothetical protein ABZX95_17270 [Streptomyces sp. NPDC004232]|uniref:hypothetical protein n=1 Tax=Streptomyces sp. NPDC004232 TaxID=3154454 RepID=UPI0033BBB317